MVNLEEFLKKTFEEDIGSGDYSSLATVSAKKKAKAHLLVKESGVIAGIQIAVSLCQVFDPRLEVKTRFADGDVVEFGDIVFDVTGPARSILAIERSLLNIMQRMSGIASKTRRMVETIKPTGCKLLDTRKTTPLNRLIEKEAVRIGGGHNHRWGLYDMILIKDNHITACGGIPKAIKRTGQFLNQKKLNLPIEIEVKNLNELEEVLYTGGIHRIMLDNFSPAQLEKAVKMINYAYESEASGGIDENNILEYALTGVMYISSGALTHSVHSLDLSLKIK